MKKKKKRYNHSEEEKVYNRLLQFFNRLLTAFSVIAVLAGAIFGYNIFSLNNELKSELANLKSKVQDIEEKSEESISITQEKADKQLEQLRSEANNLIGFTKDITESQIRFVREDVKNLALSSARVRVEEAFERGNIQSMVERQAELVIGDKLETLVNKELENISTVFEYIPIITTAYDQIRWDNRRYLDVLDTIAHFHENSYVRQIGRNLLLQKGQDYKNAISLKGKSYVTIEPRIQNMPVTQLKDFEKSLYAYAGIDSIGFNKKTESLMLKQLSDIIENSQDLYKVTASFLILNHELKIDIMPFDMRLYRELKKKYSIE